MTSLPCRYLGWEIVPDLFTCVVHGMASPTGTHPAGYLCEGCPDYQRKNTISGSCKAEGRMRKSLPMADGAEGA
jgi:hypothetical protein